MTIIRQFFEMKWGEYSLVALYISILSGIAVALQYDPASPFYSSVALDTLVPFGLFWRSLHFYSSQFFFLLSGLHLWAVVRNKSIFRLPLKKYIILCGTVPVTILLLFTGYILRGDITGESAGIIAENIILSIPWIGELLNALLFNISKEGMQNVYVNHLIGLGLLWLVLAWDHIRRYPTGFLKNSLLLFLILGISLFFKAPMDISSPGEFMITGPWFFLGIQELLRFIQPFWAGVIVPLLFLVSLAMIRLDNIWGKRALIFVCSWLILYGGITVYSLIEL